MAKVTLSDSININDASRLNQNFADLSFELNNKVLYRDNPNGEPNHMENDIDMNSNSINNLSDGVQDTQAINLRQLNDGLASVATGADAIDDAVTAADKVWSSQKVDSELTELPIVKFDDTVTNSTDGWTSSKITSELGKYSPAIETVYFITHASAVDVDPANGGIQTWTLTGNASVTFGSFLEGQSVTLMITAAVNTITWPTMNWVGGSAPTLSTTEQTVVELWKVGTTVYGAMVGDVA